MWYNYGMDKKIIAIVIVVSAAIGSCVYAQVPEVPKPVCVPVHQDGIDIPCPGENSPAPAGENNPIEESGKSPTYQNLLQNFYLAVNDGIESLAEAIRQGFDSAGNFLKSIKF